MCWTVQLSELLEKFSLLRQVKVPLGGSVRYDEDGNLIPGRMVDMVVDGNDVFIVGARSCSASVVIELNYALFQLIAGSRWESYTSEC